MHDTTRIERFEVNDSHHGPLPALALLPREPAGALPVCGFLYGGGGNAETLLALQPLLAEAWREGSLPPLLVGCLGVPPFCFYLDDAARGYHWQSAVSHGLFETVQARFGREASARRAGLVGVSMGGYGALKIALSEPERFAAMAAVAPMLEPSTEAEAVPLRNRFHYPEAVPAALLGAERDRALFAADHPVTRARQNAAGILSSGLALYLDAGSRDALCAHDGAELMHRVLWELDIPHEYHLLRDADHVGPSLGPRLLSAFRWVGHRIATQAPAEPSAEERGLREYLAEAREAASAVDPTLARTYGVLAPDFSSVWPRQSGGCGSAPP